MVTDISHQRQLHAATKARRVEGQRRQRLQARVEVIEADNDELRQDVARLLWRLEHPDVANDHRRRALAEQRTAKTDIGLGRYEAAKESLARALEADPLDGSSHLLLAEVFVVLGEYDAAKIHYRRFMALSPSTPAAEKISGLIAALP